MNMNVAQSINPVSASHNLVAQYAFGSLSSGMNLLVASLMSYRPELRSEYDNIATLNGQLLNECPPAPLSDNALDSILMKLDDPVITAPVKNQTVPGLNQDIAAPIRALLPTKIENLKWRYAYPGVRQVTLDVGDDGEEVTLLKIKPGKSAPRHTHDGLEATLILRGHYKDNETLYGPGELALADESTHHQPRAEGDEDCYCLAVTSGKLKVTDSYIKMARDFLGL